MPDTSGFTGKKMEVFLAKLSEVVGSLPAADEKARIDEDLRVLIGYLEQVRQQIRAVPSREQIDFAALERLTGLMKGVDADPVLSRVLGLPGNGRRARRPVAPTDDERERAGKIAREIELLSRDETQARLLDKKYSLALLRRVASELGIRVRSKASRTAVIDTITGKIANRRGYEILRHGGHA